MKAEFIADCHMHSQCSDGHLSAHELVELASSRQIDAISITDHDTVEAYPAAIEYGLRHQIRVLPGIELSTHFQDISVHVLGYGFDLNHPALLAPLQALKDARTQRTQAILERLQKRQIDITLDDLNKRYKQSSLTRPHIAQSMVDKGYVASIEDAFTYYLSDNHMGSLKLKSLSTEEAIALIQQAGGYAVLAHPHLIKQKKKLRALAALGFDGLEAYYATQHDKNEAILRLANQHDLFVTGGSDFHYPKPYQPLGCAYTPRSVFEQLYDRAIANNSDLIKDHV